MTELFTADALASFAALTFLEIVLGIDNIVFLAVAVGRLPTDQQKRGRILGLWMAMFLRIAMLFGLVLITRMESELFSVFGHGVTIQDLVLIAGGLFLLAKGTMEVHHEIEGEQDENHAVGGATAFAAAMVQIGVINIVFSLDSVITAIGMTNVVPIMIAAVVASTLVMLLFAKPVADFIESRPTTKMLALSFILLIGVALIADGFGFHLPRGYLYFSIAFSLFVEVLNILWHRSRRRVKAARGG
ncbi:MAG TPA: TerC family protein [Caulobacteraceae bacterium]|jgi:predicted tellurium resistance membrane protein TerC